MLNTKLLGKCTLEVFSEDPCSPENLVKTREITAYNDIHPEVRDFQEGFLNDRYNFKGQGSFGTVNSLGRTLVCFGVNGEKDPIPKSTMSDDAQLRGYLDRNHSIAIKLEASPHVVVSPGRIKSATASPWLNSRYLKFSTNLTSIQETSKISETSFGRMVAVLPVTGTGDVLKTYSVSSLNVQLPPGGHFPEGTVITSIGLATEVGVGSYRYSDKEEEEKGLTKWDRLIPNTVLQLSEPLNIGPTDYLRIKYSSGVLLSFKGNPDIYSKVVFNFKSYNNNGWWGVKNNLDAILNKGWFRLDSITNANSGSSSPSAESLDYAVFGSTAITSPRTSKSYVINEAYVDKPSYLKEEYESADFNFLNPEGVSKEPLVIIDKQYNIRYSGAPSNSYNHAESRFPAKEFNKANRGELLSVFPANSQNDFPKTKEIIQAGVISSMIANTSYFEDYWHLRNSDVEKTQFNKLTIVTTVDPSIKNKIPVVPEKYNPEIDGELPE